MLAESREELERLVEQYLEERRTLNWSPRTIESYRSHLKVFIRYLEGEPEVDSLPSVTPAVLRRYQMFLYHFTDSAGRGRTFATQRARLSAVRSFLRALVQTEVLPYDPSSTLSFPKRGRTLPRVILNPREMKKLLAAPDRTTPLGCRDRAMLEVLYSAGLRNAELRALRLGDIDMSRGVAHIRQGKNGRDRVVPIGAIALGALRRYFRESRPRLVGREDEQAVFLASITRHRLLPKTLTYLVRKYSAAAGFGERVTPHLLRHTCMTHLLQGGASSEDVRAILGHVSVGTTHIYTHVTIEDVVAAHARHHPREKLRVA